ncbi:MAG TPA: signal peptidase II, partial [Marinobacter sp.]|nr:signal peptidase II [Marinobacter sp.]
MDTAMTRQVTGTKLKWLGLAVLVIALDLGTKAMATAMLNYGDSVPVFPMFNLTLLHNTGAAFSFLADAAGWQRWFFVVLALVVSVVLINWLRNLQRHETWTAIAIALILGGALGNVYDRVVHGYVVDFLHFYWQ